MLLNIRAVRRYMSRYKAAMSGTCEVLDKVFDGSHFIGEVRSASELLILIAFGLRGWEGGFFISHKQHS